MFEDTEKNTKLKEAQRKQNDFTKFFRHEKSQVQSMRTLGSMDMTNNKTLQDLNLETLKENAVQKQENKRYKREQDIDQFLNRQIMGKGFSNSQKIDMFLSKQQEWASQGETVPIQQVLHDKNMQDPNYSLHYSYLNKTQGTNNSTLNKSLSLQNSKQSIKSQQPQASYSFSGPPRFWMTKNSNKVGITQFNSVVQDSLAEQNKPEFLDQIINKKVEAKHDINKLTMPNKNNKEIEDRTQREKTLTEYLKSPADQRKELKERKDQQEKYHEWKKNSTQKLKQFQLLKNGYRSGVLSMDGPSVSQSQVYNEEHNKFQQAQLKKEQEQQQRIKNMEKYLLSNPDISFNNLNQEKYKFQDKQNKKIFPTQSYEMDPEWISRKKGINTVQKLPTFQNCFGHNLEDQKQSIENPRSRYLREKDVGGKNFNPITGVQSEKLFHNE